MLRVGELVAFLVQFEQSVSRLWTDVLQLLLLRRWNLGLVCVRVAHGVDVVDGPLVSGKHCLVVYLHDPSLQVSI